MASESIAHSAFGLMGYWLKAHSGSRNNCLIDYPIGSAKFGQWLLIIKNSQGDQKQQNTLNELNFDWFLIIVFKVLVQHLLKKNC